MNILMLGWEFPPFIAGGVGIHCRNLTEQLSKKGVNVIYVMPKREREITVDYMKIINVESKGLYIYNTINGDSHELMDNVKFFTQNIIDAVKDIDFDIIHCHEWVTYDAGIQLKKITGKPLVISIHATEYDRTPHNPWNAIIEIEKRGLLNADRIITVSNMMKKTLQHRYGIKGEKVDVIYNGINLEKFRKNFNLQKDNPIILFVGRLFVQKGVEYFLKAAKKVLEHRNDVDFIVVGNGDLMPYLIDLSIKLNIQDHVFFTGFIPEEEKIKYYKISDCFVMPSVSEPFGITALEAVASETPLIISKNSGCSEVISHSLKVDFWDTHKMADYILAIIEYDGLKEEMVKNSYEESKRLSWSSIADQTLNTYKKVIGSFS